MDSKTARAHAAALNVAFTDYLDALRALNTVEECAPRGRRPCTTWPPHAASC
jgi:hypothetical protein